jgi:hypothetical protein
MGKLRTRRALSPGPPGWQTETTELWYEESVDGWVFAFRLRGTTGHAEFSEIRIFPDNGEGERPAGSWDTDGSHPGRGITGAVLRKAVPSEWLKSLRSDELPNLLAQIPEEQIELAKDLGDLSYIDSPLADIGLLSESQLKNRPSRPGWKGHPDSYYLPFAIAIDEATQEGRRDTNVRAAMVLGGWCSPRMIKDARPKCVERGLLTKGPGPGKGGGRLTAKAKALMKEQADD